MSTWDTGNGAASSNGGFAPVATPAEEPETRMIVDQQAGGAQ